ARDVENAGFIASCPNDIHYIRNLSNLYWHHQFAHHLNCTCNFVNGFALYAQLHYKRSYLRLCCFTSLALAIYGLHFFAFHFFICRITLCISSRSKLILSTILANACFIFITYPYLCSELVLGCSGVKPRNTILTAANSALPLFRVSCHSFSATESATTPAPA